MKRGERAQTVESDPASIEPDAAFIYSSCNRDAVSRSNSHSRPWKQPQARLIPDTYSIPLQENRDFLKAFPRDPKYLLRYQPDIMLAEGG